MKTKRRRDWLRRCNRGGLRPANPIFRHPAVEKYLAWVSSHVHSTPAISHVKHWMLPVIAVRHPHPGSRCQRAQLDRQVIATSRTQPGRNSFGATKKYFGSQLDICDGAPIYEQMGNGRAVIHRRLV